MAKGDTGAGLASGGIPSVRADAAVPAELAALVVERGCVVVESVLSPSELSVVHDELESLAATASLPANEFFGRATRRIYDPFARTRVLDDVVLHPLLQTTVELVIGPAQFGMTVLSDVRPGEVAQRLHRDAAVYPLPDEFGPVMVNMIWAIDSFTPDNGATVVAPRSHHSTGRHSALDPLTLAPATMAGGSVLLYDGRLVHGAGANRSTTGRLGLIVEHVARWLRPNENHTLAIPPSLAATLQPGLQALLGYNQHSAFCGFVAGRHPLDWLAEKTTETPNDL